MEPDQLDDPVLYRQELIKTHSRRLKALEFKAAKYGLECPVSIEVEITEIKEKIAALGGEINDLAKYRNFFDIRKKNRIIELESTLRQYNTPISMNSPDKGFVRTARSLMSSIYRINDNTDSEDRLENVISRIKSELTRIDDDDYNIELLY